ncbi:sensory neuron membrane protein 1-like, partial [Oppia nitens]|uniref:sensory neuron membrane protein 1-like n=1 Tax=Oppia nitens TaxID=1686743 RepID=UPI0023DBCB37
MPWLVRTVIKSQMYISKGFSPIRYALEFSNGQLPEHIGVYIKFCIFSIQNPREFSAGARARLREMGPYVYRLRGQIKIMDW